MLAARAHPDRHDLVLEEVDPPVPGAGEVVVRVRAAGLAPGLFHLLRQGRVPLLPATMGHEIAGDVDAVGPGVDDVEIGRRVRVHPNLSCGSCDYCRSDREQMCSECAMIGHAVFGPVPSAQYRRFHDGGFAERVLVPAGSLDTLPDGVSYDIGAKVHDLANAWRALTVAALSPDSVVVITAATGTMGTSAVKLAPLFGVGRIIAVGRSAKRLDEVRRLAPHLVETVALDSLPAGWEGDDGLTGAVLRLVPGGAHAVLDFLPAGPGTRQALQAMRNGGTLVHMGGSATPLDLPPVALSVRCWRVAGTRNCTRSDARAVLDALGSGAIDAEELVTHRFRLADIDRAVRSVLDRSEPIWMATVRP